MNFVLEMDVPETEATTESELRKLEYLEPLLKKKRLIPKRMAKTIPIFDLPNDLNIFNFYEVAFIILVTRKESKYAEN